MIRKTILAFCCLALASPALAQQPTFHDALLDSLVGHWVLTGTIGKKTTTHDVTATWVLNHQYLEFQEISREKNKDGTPVYEAAVYIAWDQPTSEYVCAFLDVFGDISTESFGHAPRKGDSIALVFQDRKDTGKFHNTLTYRRADDSWTMNMDQEDPKGKLTPFARTTLTKAK
jgi:hypothetical protein